MNVVRTLIFRLVFYFGSIFFVLSAPLMAAIGRRALVPLVVGWGRFHDWCTRKLLNIHWRVEGELPTEPVLVAIKHEAMYETVQPLVFLDRPAPVLKRELMNIPFWGKACQRYGGIVVDRDAGAAALRVMLTEARQIIAEGRPIMIFPEGTRVPPGEAPPLKSGISGLYRLLKLPVVPIACDSGRLLPKRGPKRAGMVTFKVGETIPPGLPREEFEARVHKAINALNDRAAAPS
jgi:1-acyl-sn-glycerol-3-phosphate acyltransferase